MVTYASIDWSNLLATVGNLQKYALSKSIAL